MEKNTRVKKIVFFKAKLGVLIGKTVALLRKTEQCLVLMIKKNQTKAVLDFFRKDSPLFVVFLVSSLVVTGNVGLGEEKNGFLLGKKDEIGENEQIIKKRVESQSFRGNLTNAELSLADAPEMEEDIQSLMMKDGNLNQNQMQYTVISSITPPNTEELLAGGADVAVYEVKNGDTLSVIAEKFKVTQNTILWANDITNPDMIQPGDKIFILPTTGVKHVVKDGENLDKIAKKYQADKERIIDFNEIPADGSVKVGQELIIPDGKIETVIPATPQNALPQRNYYASGVTTDDSATRGPSIIDKNPKGGHSFPYGYCTWYVAQNKYVPWSGNAGTWLYHAKAYGASTGKTPKKGSIIVTNESWYGHVGIVTGVSGGSVTIREMNYVGFAKVSTRTISANSRVIMGYIY